MLTIEFREDAVGEIMGLDLGLNVNQTTFYKHTYIQSLRFRTHLIGGLLAAGLASAGGQKAAEKEKIKDLRSRKNPAPFFFASNSLKQ